MDRIYETARRAVRAHFLTTGDTKKHGHPRAGLGGELVRHGYSDGEAAAVHTKAAQHMMGRHGMSHDQALDHLNGERGKALGARLGRHKPDHAVRDIAHHVDAHLAA